MGLQIFANIDASSLGTASVISSNDLRPKTLKPFAAGDSTVVDLFLTGNGGLQNLQDYPTVRLGIGSLNARPESGSFTYGAQTVNFTTDLTTLASNLNTAIQTENGATCTVTSLGGFAFEVNFTVTGAQTIATVDAGLLNPESTVSINEIVAGDFLTEAQWIIRLFRNPISLVDTFTDIDDGGLRGSLNIGTVGVYELLAGQTSVETTMELEVIDSDGNIQTLFQTPLTITGEVIGQGVSGPAVFSSYATASQLVEATTRSNYIIVSAEDGSDTNGLREREDRPFATPSAAVAVATANDTIIIRDGNFSNDQITIPESVTIAANPSSIGPLCVSTATRQFTLIGPFSGLTHESQGTATLGGVDMNFLEVTASAGHLTAINSRFAARATETHNAVEIKAPCNVKLDNCRITSDTEGEAAISVSTFSQKSVVLSDCEVKAAASTGTFAAHPMKITSTLTGLVQIKNCTFIGTDGTGTFVAKAIEADTACTVQIQGSLNSNVDVSSTVTLDGGIFNQDSNYDI